MKKRRSVLAGCMVLMLLLSACGGGTSKMTQDMAASSAPAAAAPMEPMAESAELSMTQQLYASKSESKVYQNAGAKLIRRAELVIQTTQFDQAIQALDELVIQHGGYYESASLYGGSYRNAHANRSGEYVIRIPAAQFTAFQSSTGALGYVTRSTESSEDVGERYYDAEARLKTQRTKQERLLSLLEKAATMEDIIDLENALSDVEYEIEQLSSTLNRYDALISYSTFTIYLEEVYEVTEEVGEKESLIQRMSAGFTASGKGIVQGMQNLMVWFSYHVFGVIFLISICAVIGIIVKRKNITSFYRKGRKKEE